ncbi:hypothetical protein HYE68_008232 [Fusarium pseudograminearum]|nr:hypothetical protein HYE68_008232 [Fusarium pseudograminearum]
MDSKDTTKKLRDWYQDQSPLTVDIVGDFAGQELFAIHGESLIRYCLTEAKVDLDEGFQLLHAVHAVEKVLSELKRRDCNFDVLFFRDHENICVSQQAVGSTKGAKYRLTRRILIQHFIKSNLDFRILEFDSFKSNECKNYLSGHGVHFMLCDDGRAANVDQATHLQHLIMEVMESGRHVGIMNSITWRSSKVFMSLLSGKKNALCGSSLQLPEIEAKEPLSLSKAVLLQTTQHSFSDANLPGRDKHAVVFCRAYIEHCASTNKIIEADLHRVEAFLLQAATLRHCSLQERACVEVSKDGEIVSSQDHEFLHMFCATTQGLMEVPSELNEQEGCELFDIVDGRVFFYFLRAIRSEGEVPTEILEHANVLYNETFRGQNPEPKKPFATLKPSKVSRPPPEAGKNLTALPFSHPVLDTFLKDVEIGESEETQDPNAELVFEDLRHWHAYKPITQLKSRERYPIWVEKARQKKMQLRMAEVSSYAASLTNITGKTFNRETIVVSSRPKQSISTASKIAQPKHHKQKPGKGGKQSAIMEAQKLIDQKAQVKLMDIMNHWRDKYNEFEKVNSPIDRYLKALDFQSKGSSGNHDAVKPEVQLYLCHVLMEIWTQVRKKTCEDSREVSMIWNWLGKISKSANCTHEIASAVQQILKVLAATPLPIATLETSRTLPFFIRPITLKRIPELVKNTRLLQLEHGGPYMDRRFDSQPDARVQFEPDAWQRDVLDCIDLLLLAPCPIIALSATVGNPNELKDWLATSQANRFVLDDVSLEARDCLTLWKHMRKTFAATLLSDTAKLDPVNVLPEWIEKHHVIEWEKDLKVVLRGAMQMENSPFPGLQESLRNLESPDQPVVTLERHFEKLFPLEGIRVPRRSEALDDEENLSKLDLAREEESDERDFDDMVSSLTKETVDSWLIDALRRGLGVHHAGMNRRYRQIRIPIKRTPKRVALAARSPSEIFLRRLPEPAEKLMINHNQDVLSIFKDYVSSYICQHLHDKPDRELPLTKVLVGPRKPCDSSFMGRNPAVIRSPFAALSGFGDDFTTIKELCSDVRGGVFLEESAVSYIPIWPHDTDTEFNAYLYDFFKHGSLKGDVWFYLKDFSLVLKTIVTSLKGVMSAEGDYDLDGFGEDDTFMEESEETEMQKPEEVVEKTAKKSKAVIADSWEDDSDEESEPENTGSTAANTTSQSSVDRKGGLILVLKAFKLLEEEFSPPRITNVLEARTETPKKATNKTFWKAFSFSGVTLRSGAGRRVPGLEGEGLNGVIEHTGKTGLKNKMTVYVMLSNHEWYLLRIPPRQQGKIEIHDVQKTICHTK